MHSCQRVHLTFGNLKLTVQIVVYELKTIIVLLQHIDSLDDLNLLDHWQNELIFLVSLQLKYHHRTVYLIVSLLDLQILLQGPSHACSTITCIFVKIEWLNCSISFYNFSSVAHTFFQVLNFTFAFNPEYVFDSSIDMHIMSCKCHVIYVFLNVFDLAR